MIGDTFGPYVVRHKIGAGGMGEVYLADDTRLRRRVALKVLSASSTGDAIAAERLLREARAAAQLDHPNICTVFDTGEADGHPYIAMQFVEGEPLSARVERPLSVHEVVSIAAQVARALAQAHDRGIVHRDIKPHNVMVDNAGKVKVLDFGLAQSVLPAGLHDTTAAKLTDPGVIAGTVRYMSPEQLQNRPIDGRSDIFSLGTMLFELLSRSHPFGAGSGADTIAAILTKAPRELPDSVPVELRRIVLRCLEKDRDRRYQSARDLALDLDAVFHQPARPKSGFRSRVWIGAVALFAVILLAALWLMADRSPSSVTSAEYVQLTNFADSASAPALSPDGTMVAFVRDNQWFLSSRGVWVKRLPSGEATQLTADPRPKYNLQFSPDGNNVLYTVIDQGWHTWSVPIAGGEGARMLPNAAGLSWIDNQRVLFSEIRGGLHMGVVTSTPTRAEQRDVYFPAHERAMAHYSAISPDRKWVLIVEMDKTGGWDPCRIVPFEGQVPMRFVGPPGACRSAKWSPDGRWMYFEVFDGIASHIWRQRFPDGTPEPVTSGTATDEQGIAMAPDGRSLIASVGGQSSALWLRGSSGERLLSPEGFADYPCVSRDGKRVYYLLRRVGSTARHLAVIGIEDGRTEDLLPGIDLESFAISSDERTVAYVTSDPHGARQVWLAALDRSSAPRMVVDQADSVAFGPNGSLVFRSIGQQANYLERIAPDGTGRARIADWPILTHYGTSPDGLWAVVHRPRAATHATSVESVAVPVTGGEARALCRPNCIASWSGDGRSLYLIDFLTNRTLVVPVTSGRWFPEFPSDESGALAVWEKAVPGARWIDTTAIARGSDPANYVYVKRDDRRNLFRIPIR